MAPGWAVQKISIAVIVRWQNGVGLQKLSASRLWSSSVGPAGRRRAALFSGGWPARVPNPLARLVSDVGRRTCRRPWKQEVVGRRRREALGQAASFMEAPSGPARAGVLPR